MPPLVLARPSPLRPAERASSFFPPLSQLWSLRPPAHQRRNSRTNPSPRGPHVRPFPRPEPEGSLRVGFRPGWRKEPWNETFKGNHQNEKYPLGNSGGPRPVLHGHGARSLQVHRLRRPMLPLRLRCRLLLNGPPSQKSHAPRETGARLFSGVRRLDAAFQRSNALSKV